MATYRFRYDARGKALIIVRPPAPAPHVAQPSVTPPAPQDSAEPPVASARESLQAPVVAAPKPEPPLSSIVLPPFVKISDVDVPTMSPNPLEVILNLKEWLEDHPNFGLEIDLLEEREILKTPPHWSYVSNDLEVRSSSPSSDPDCQEQRRAADQYVRMLLERQADVERAVELAAFASVASTEQQDDSRMRDALHALPKGGKVDQEVFEEIRKLDLLPPPPFPTFLLAEDIRKWADALLDRYVQIVNSNRKIDWLSVEKASWETWKIRLDGYHKRPRRRPFPVDLNDLLLRTRKAGSAVIFRNELAEMSLREWSDALWASRKRTLPRPSALSVPDWVHGQIAMELFGGRKTVVMIVGDSATSSSSQWLPSKLNGCLWVAKDRWMEDYPSYWHTIAKDADHWMIVVELSDDAKSLPLIRQSPATLISTPTNPPGVVLTMAYMAKVKLPPEVTPIVPYVENPKNVDDLVSRIESLIGRSQPAS